MSFMSLLSFCTVVIYVSHSNGAQVVPKVEEDADEVPATLIPTSTTATESAPDVSAHSAGPPGETAGDKLRRRTSHQPNGSDEDQPHPGSED